MLSRNPDLALKAFINNDIEATKNAHNQQPIVYGGFNGIITAFAVACASLSSGIVLILDALKVWITQRSAALRICNIVRRRGWREFSLLQANRRHIFQRVLLLAICCKTG